MWRKATSRKGWLMQHTGDPDLDLSVAPLMRA